MTYRADPPGTHPDYDVPAYRSSALRHPRQQLNLLPVALLELGDLGFESSHLGNHYREVMLKELGKALGRDARRSRAPPFGSLAPWRGAWPHPARGQKRDGGPALGAADPPLAFQNPWAMIAHPSARTARPTRIHIT